MAPSCAMCPTLLTGAFTSIFASCTSIWPGRARYQQHLSTEWSGTDQLADALLCQQHLPTRMKQGLRANPLRSACTQLGPKTRMPQCIWHTSDSRRMRPRVQQLAQFVPCACLLTTVAAAAAAAAAATTAIDLYHRCCPTCAAHRRPSSWWWLRRRWTWWLQMAPPAADRTHIGMKGRNEEFAPQGSPGGLY